VIRNRIILSNDNVELNESIGRNADTDELDDFKPGVAECQTKTLGTKQILGFKDDRGNAHSGYIKLTTADSTVILTIDNCELQDTPKCQSRIKKCHRLPFDGFHKVLRHQRGKQYGRLPSWTG
jgi:hypothetical protein